MLAKQFAAARHPPSATPDSERGGRVRVLSSRWHKDVRDQRSIASGVAGILPDQKALAVGQAIDHPPRRELTAAGTTADTAG